MGLYIYVKKKGRKDEIEIYEGTCSGYCRFKDTVYAAAKKVHGIHLAKYEVSALGFPLDRNDDGKNDKTVVDGCAEFLGPDPDGDTWSVDEMKAIVPFLESIVDTLSDKDDDGYEFSDRATASRFVAGLKAGIARNGKALFG